MSSTLRATPFRHTRRHHHTEAAEDYTELIAELIRESGEARLTQLARRLGIAERTVKAHLTSVFQRLGVTDRTQAALWALEHLSDPR